MVLFFAKYSLCSNIRSLNSQCKLSIPAFLIPALFINFIKTNTRTTKSWITGLVSHFSLEFAEIALILEISSCISLVLWYHADSVQSILQVIFHEQKAVVYTILEQPLSLIL